LNEGPRILIRKLFCTAICGHKFQLLRPKAKLKIDFTTTESRKAPDKELSTELYME